MKNTHNLINYSSQTSSIYQIKKFNTINRIFNMHLIAMILMFFILQGKTLAQVKIGDNPSVINSSSLLELESNDKGFLLPRMTTALRDAISNPANGLEIYNTSTNHINYYDGSVWTSMENVVRNNHVLVKNESDFPTPSGGVITLQTNTTYEINGAIIVADKIDLNGATIFGQDGLEDQLIHTGSGELFTGSKGGAIRNILIASTSSGSQIFNLEDAGQTETLIVRSCIFNSNKKIATIKGYANVFFSECFLLNNDDGFTFENIEHLILLNLTFLGSNKGTYVKLVDGSHFHFIEIEGGFMQVESATSAIAIDFGSGVMVMHGGIIQTSLHGSGTHLTGVPSKEWDIISQGVDEQSDDVATGNFYITTGATTLIPSVNTPTKIAGTTTGVNLFRVSSSVDNRLTYEGTKTRVFMLAATLSLTASENTKRFNFYIAKNGALLNETVQRIKIGSSTDVRIVPLTGIVTLSPGDYIEVWVENTDNGSNLFVESMNLAIF